MNVTRNRHDTEDIIGNSIVRVLTKHHKTTKEQFRAWWATVVKHEMLNFFYRDTKQKKIQKTIRITQKCKKLVKLADDDEPQEQKRMRMVLACLAPVQQRVFYQCVGLGMTQRAVADDNNISNRESVQEYKEYAIHAVKQIWKIFEISPDIQHIDLLSTTQVGKLLGCCAETVIKKIKNKEFPSIIVGKNNKIDRSWLPK